MSCTGEWAGGASLSRLGVFEHTGAYQSQLLCSTCPENKSGEKDVIESFHSLLQGGSIIEHPIKCFEWRVYARVPPIIPPIGYLELLEQLIYSLSDLLPWYSAGVWRSMDIHGEGGANMLPM